MTQQQSFLSTVRKKIYSDIHDNFGTCQDSPPGQEKEADREKDGKITSEIGWVWN